MTKESIHTFEGPLLVDTGKGLSVSWQGRFLYSSRVPAAIPERTATQIEIRPETLLFCPSPLLGYGFTQLLERLPQDCVILSIETKPELMAITASNLEPQVRHDPRFKCFQTTSVVQVLKVLETLPSFPFRRTLRLDLSGGSKFDSDFYDECLSAIDEFLAQWWKNRFTLMKLGRSYARNTFRNLLRATASTSINELTNISGNRHICVCGAGPSLDPVIPHIKANREQIYIVAVDTAAPSLIAAGIKPDILVLLESQYWIEESLYSVKGSGIPLIADLTSRPQACAIPGGPVYFCLTRYAETKSLKRLSASFPTIQEIPPLGSVGLVALHLLRQLTAAEKPILFCGLDFSWTTGYTHSREAPAPVNERRRHNRTSPINSEPPSLSEGVYGITGPLGTAYTNPALSHYAQLCELEIQGKNYIDIGEKGLLKESKKLHAKKALAPIEKYIAVEQKIIASAEVSQSQPNEDFLVKEKNDLERLRSILSGTRTDTALKADDEIEIMEILGRCDYLWLHFPDGHRGPSIENTFLRRVRIEIEYFLKTIDTAIRSK